MRWFITLLIVMLVPSALNTLQAAEMRMAVTTSFHNSGLSDILLPEIKRELDIDVHLIVVGTGRPSIRPGANQTNQHNLAGIFKTCSQEQHFRKSRRRQRNAQKGT